MFKKINLSQSNWIRYKHVLYLFLNLKQLLVLFDVFFSELATVRVRPERQEPPQVHGPVHVRAGRRNQPGHTGKINHRFRHFCQIPFYKFLDKIRTFSYQYVVTIHGELKGS
jgi:hypothetical protein